MSLLEKFFFYFVFIRSVLYWRFYCRTTICCLPRTKETHSKPSIPCCAPSEHSLAGTVLYSLCRSLESHPHKMHPIPIQKLKVVCFYSIWQLNRNRQFQPQSHTVVIRENRCLFFEFLPLNYCFWYSFCVITTL